MAIELPRTSGPDEGVGRGHSSLTSARRSRSIRRISRRWPVSPDNSSRRGGSVSRSQLYVASAVVAIGLFASAQAVHPQERAPRSSELELVPVQGNISMLAGAGGNITVQVGKDGVLL